MLKSEGKFLVLADPQSEAYQTAYKNMPEKWKTKFNGNYETWKEFRHVADEEIGRYLASVEGLLTWRQIFRLIRKKIVTWLKDKDL